MHFLNLTQVRTRKRLLPDSPLVAGAPGQFFLRLDLRNLAIVRQEFGSLDTGSLPSARGCGSSPRQAPLGTGLAQCERLRRFGETNGCRRMCRTGVEGVLRSALFPGGSVRLGRDGRGRRRTQLLLDRAGVAVAAWYAGFPLLSHATPSLSESRL